MVGGNPLPLEDAKAICEKEAEDASYQSNTPEYQRAFEVHTYRECMQTNGWLARYVREVF